MIATIAGAACVAALLALGIWVHIENQHYGRLITTVVGQQATIRTALRAHGIDVDGDDQPTVVFDRNITTDTAPAAKVLIERAFEDDKPGRHRAKEEV